MKLKTTPILLLAAALVAGCSQPDRVVGEGINGRIYPLDPDHTYCGEFIGTTIEGQYFRYELRNDETVYFKGFNLFQTESEFGNASVDESWMKVVTSEFGMSIYMKDSEGKWYLTHDVVSLMDVPGTAEVIHDGVTIHFTVDSIWGKTIEFDVTGCFAQGSA